MVKCSIGHEREIIRKEHAVKAANKKFTIFTNKVVHQKSSRVSWDGTLVSLRGLLERTP